MKTSVNKLTFVLLGLTFLILVGACEKPKDEDAETNDDIKVESRTFSNSSWAYSSPSYYLDLSVPELTAGNINSAAVLVYFSIVDGTWRAVPYTQYTSTYNYFMNFTSSVGSVKVTWTYNSSLSSGDDPNKYFGANVKFKVVVIPPAANALKRNIDYTNYDQVSNAYNLDSN